MQIDGLTLDKKFDPSVTDYHGTTKQNSITFSFEPSEGVDVIDVRSNLNYGFTYDSTTQNTSGTVSNLAAGENLIGVRVSSGKIGKKSVELDMINFDKGRPETELIEFLQYGIPVKYYKLSDETPDWDKMQEIKAYIKIAGTGDVPYVPDIWYDKEQHLSKIFYSTLTDVPIAYVIYDGCEFEEQTIEPGVWIVDAGQVEQLIMQPIDAIKLEWDEYEDGAGYRFFVEKTN